MGEMSSIVSRRPSSRNHLKEAFWMSIRLGRSRTCLRREKVLRARGAAVVLLKMRSLPWNYGVRVRGSPTGTEQNSEKDGACASAAVSGLLATPEYRTPRRHRIFRGLLGTSLVETG